MINHNRKSISINHLLRSSSFKQHPIGLLLKIDYMSLRICVNIRFGTPDIFVIVVMGIRVDQLVFAALEIATDGFAEWDYL